MPRGRKKNYHARGRHFTNPDELKAAEQREAREKEWRRQRGLPSDEDSAEDEESGATAGGEASRRGARGGATGRRTHGAPGELPPSSSEEEESSDDDDKEEKHKGVQHLIQIENPNHVKQKSKKVTTLKEEEGPQLTRREKEELEKAAAKERYMKQHLAGKTEEARADMARLALIRKQREEAAKKREEERLAQDEKKKEAEAKLLEKKKADKDKK